MPYWKSLVIYTLYIYYIFNCEIVRFYSLNFVVILSVKIHVRKNCDITLCIESIVIDFKNDENVINSKFIDFDIKYGIYFIHETGLFCIFTCHLQLWKYPKSCHLWSKYHIQCKKIEYPPFIYILSTNIKTLVILHLKGACFVQFTVRFFFTNDEKHFP